MNCRKNDLCLSRLSHSNQLVSDIHSSDFFPEMFACQALNYKELSIDYEFFSTTCHRSLHLPTNLVTSKYFSSIFLLYSSVRNSGSGFIFCSNKKSHSISYFQFSKLSLQQYIFLHRQKFCNAIKQINHEPKHCTHHISKFTCIINFWCRSKNNLRSSEASCSELIVHSDPAQSLKFFPFFEQFTQGDDASTHWTFGKSVRHKNQSQKTGSANDMLASQSH